MTTTQTIELRLKDLETPAFRLALAALQANRGRVRLITQGDYDSFLRSAVSVEAADAWRAYKDLEDTLP